MRKLEDTHVLILYDEGLLERGLQQLHHRHVVEVVADMFEDVAVGHETECAEDHRDRDVLVHVRDPRAYVLRHCELQIRVPINRTSGRRSNGERTRAKAT